MAVKGRGSGRPDHTKSIVGDQGKTALQDGDKLVTRAGATSQQDIDVGTESNPHDLMNDGDFVTSDPEIRDVGGAGSIQFDLKSIDAENFSVTIEWFDDNDNKVATVDKDVYPQLKANTTWNVDRIQKAVPVVGDRAKVTITAENNSGDNRIHGSIYFAPGSPYGASLEELSVHNRPRIFQVSPGANTDILSNDIRMQNSKAQMLVSVTVDAAANFNIMVKDRDSDTTVAIDMNEGNALTANADHTFEFQPRGRFTEDYNFQVDTAVQVVRLVIDEVPVKT